MLAGLVARRRHQVRERERASLSGASDNERVGGARRKRRKRECQHDPWARDLAQILMGAYYWLSEPTSIKAKLGNGLENTVWSRLCMNERSILIGMIGYRMLSCLLVQTYYVPDEYWQSLEVAHHQAFGKGFLTWEWSAKIRSYFYPSMFTLLYKALDITGLDSFTTVARLPRVIQAVCYGVSDLYLYRLSCKLAGPLVGQWTLLANCLSWFTFYCGSRTLTNTMETALITIGLNYYPWTRLAAMSSGAWKFLWVAALSVMARPTAAIIWIPLCICHIVATRRRLWNTFILYSLTVLAFGFISARIDKAFYGEWTFVPYNFFLFNVGKQISHFYGTHPWHWYFTQGLPFVLSTHSLLLLAGWKICSNRSLQLTLVWTVFIYSCLAHKEFRFILPVVPMAMHVCGYYLTVVHQRAEVVDKQTDKMETVTEEQVHQQLEKVKQEEAQRDSGLTASELSDSMSEAEIAALVNKRLRATKKRPLVTTRRLVILLVVGNLPMMLYFSILHQRGSLDVVKFLHSESLLRANMSVIFLTPCHSTPYYSHVHANVSMRFLTCQPNLSDVDDYSTEAQQFFTDPVDWLKREVVRGPNKRVYSHVVMFENLQPIIENFLSKGRYSLCSKHFYSHLPEEEEKSKHLLVFCRKEKSVV